MTGLSKVTKRYRSARPFVLVQIVWNISLSMLTSVSPLFPMIFHNCESIMLCHNQQMKSNPTVFCRTSQIPSKILFNSFQTVKWYSNEPLWRDEERRKDGTLAVKLLQLLIINKNKRISQPKHLEFVIYSIFSISVPLKSSTIFGRTFYGWAVIRARSLALLDPSEK